MTSPMLANEANGWTKLHGDPPPTLHHYTTGQGLLGMLQAGRLWATNAHFMNDPKEITYAADIVQRAVREAADRHKAAVDALDPGWMDKLITFGRDRAWKAPKIEQWSSDAIRTFDEQGGAYIACFCREPDLLSQWRGYGAVGGGYAVGFNSADLATRSTDRLRPLPAAAAVSRRPRLSHPVRRARPHREGRRTPGQAAHIGDQLRTGARVRHGGAVAPDISPGGAVRPRHPARYTVEGSVSSVTPPTARYALPANTRSRGGRRRGG